MLYQQYLTKYQQLKAHTGKFNPEYAKSFNRELKNWLGNKQRIGATVHHEDCEEFCAKLSNDLLFKQNRVIRPEASRIEWSDISAAIDGSTMLPIVLEAGADSFFCVKLILDDYQLSESEIGVLSNALGAHLHKSDLGIEIELARLLITEPVGNRKAEKVFDICRRRLKCTVFQALPNPPERGIKGVQTNIIKRLLDNYTLAAL